MVHVDIVRILSVNETISDIIESMISEFTIDLATAGVPEWITVNAMVINPDVTNIVYSIDADAMYEDSGSEVFSVIVYKTGDIFPFSINTKTFNNYIKNEIDKKLAENANVDNASITLDADKIKATIKIDNIDVASQIPYEISVNDSVIQIVGTTPSSLTIDGHAMPDDSMKEIFTEDISFDIDISSAIPRNLFDLSDINIDETM